MTATLPLVKMAECSPVEGEGVDTENIGSTSSLQVTKLIVRNSETKLSSPVVKSKVISLDGEKAYETVAKFEVSDLKNFFEEVVSRDRSKNDKSAIAQFLIRKEEDALREESGSGEDTIEQAYCRQKKKRASCKKDHYVGTHLGASSRNNTGGSLGSLHNLSDPKIPVETTTHTQGVASRSRTGGSCGNLSKGSFETHACKRRNRRSREINKASASTSQREGGSLQNLSKAEAASNESKKLHKSGSLSQVFGDVAGIRFKNRRQKTSSESSGRTYCRRSEEREVGPGESSEEEVGEFAYQRLVPSSHSSVSGHSGDPGEATANGMVGATWTEDHDVASGETTEEDGELHHISARCKLGGEAGSRHHYHHSSHHHSDSDTELHSVVTHTSHRDVLPTISSDSEVDKPIKFSLGANGSKENLSESPSYNESCCVNSFDLKSSFRGADSEANEKRKLRCTKSDGANFEKSSLDENGNPILNPLRNLASGNSFVSSASSLQSSGCERFSATSGAISTSKRNGFSAQTKDISMYSRMKAKQDKKKAIKEKDVMPSEKTPGFRGDDTLDAILKFLGAENSSHSKSKKKKEGGAKKGGGKAGRTLTDKGLGDDEYEGVEESGSVEETENAQREDSGSDTREESKKGAGKRRNKKGAGRLRESSSVEDLVSKSKQSDTVKGVQKQVTVDDGGTPYHGRESKMKSEFSYDFYRVGDALIEPEPGAGETGDFEVVGKKRGKKANRTASQGSKSGGSGGGWSSGSGAHSFSDEQRRATFPRSNFPGGGVFGSRSGRGSHSDEKPEINFTEGPFTAHDGVFLSQFSGNRSGVGGERYTTTTSVPHSEDSDSDGGDSVHSMPAHTTTPRPQVRKPPPSNDSTPQTSYANIAKLAASANKAQMKRVAVANHIYGSGGGHAPRQKATPSDDDVSDKANMDDSSTSQDTKNDSSIMDENFPPLHGGCVPPLSPNAVASTNGNNNNNICNKNNENVIANCESSFTISADSGKKETKVTQVTHPSPSSESSLSENAFKVSPSNPSHSNAYANHIGQNISQQGQSISQPGQNISQHPTATSQKIQSSISNQIFPQSTAHALPIAAHASTKASQTNVKPNVPQSQPNHSNTAQKALVNGPLTIKNRNQVSNDVKTSSTVCRTTPTPAYSNVTAPHNAAPPAQEDKVQCQNRSVCSNNVGNIGKSSDKNKSSTLRENKAGISSRENKGSSSNKHFKRFEEAVIFTDNTKFDIRISDIEFGFGMSLEDLSNLTDNSPDNNKITSKKKSRTSERKPINEKPLINDKIFVNEKTPVNEKPRVNEKTVSENTPTSGNTTTSEKPLPNERTLSNEKTPNLDTLKKSPNSDILQTAPSVDSNKNVKNLESIKRDFSKMFRPPVNDTVSYNYEELCRHLITGWESTLKLFDEDPKNIQYWKPGNSDPVDTV